MNLSLQPSRLPELAGLTPAQRQHACRQFFGAPEERRRWHAPRLALFVAVVWGTRELCLLAGIGPVLRAVAVAAAVALTVYALELLRLERQRPRLAQYLQDHAAELAAVG